MCGIVGLARHDASEEVVTETVARMAEQIAHRGPDGGGLTYHPEATLGMRRLAIVDVAHGHQPMSSDGGEVALVFNGEIYNAPALRAELEARGVRFRTRSDTEVILRLYQHDPETVEERLAGMWAFAIHDRRRRNLVLSRDRFGIKPLFLCESGTAIAFGSELRCFARSLPWLSSAFTLDPTAAHAMLTFSVVPCESTIYRGVRRLAPATRLTIDLATGEKHERRYWVLTPSSTASRVRSQDEACEAVEQLLRQSVREHLESDVPLAMFLSGGIDSSLIARYAQETSPRKIQAYSIGFGEAGLDESPYARQTAAKLGIDLRVAVLDETEALRQLPDALLAYDEPFGDSSSVATFMLSSIVGAGFKVALAGDGGDEVFAGYRKYQLARFRRVLARAPRLRELGARALGHLPGRDDGTISIRNLLPLMRRRARGFIGTDAEVYARLTQFAPLTETAPLIDAPSHAARYLDTLSARFESAEGTELQRTLAVDLQSSLTNDMLVKVDRASMARHLEVRVPFLDHRVVEYGVGLPERFLLAGGGKRTLRVLHERRFGKALARRPKQGFVVPVARWLRGPFADACRRLFDAKRLERFGLLSPRELSEGRHAAWLERHPAVVWHAFTLATWCEATLGDGPDALRELLSPARPQRPDRE